MEFDKLKETYKDTIANAISFGPELIPELEIILKFLRDLASENGHFLNPI